MIWITRCFCVLIALAVVATLLQSQKVVNEQVNQSAVELVVPYQTQSAQSLLSALAQKDMDSVEEILEAEWTPSVELYRDLFVALDGTNDNEWRFVLERAVSRCIGATQEEHQRAKLCMGALRNDHSGRVRDIAGYYAEFMIPYDFIDDQNQHRMRFTNSNQDSLRWLAIRHLSFCRRYYLIEESPEILFRIAKGTPKMVVPCLIDQLHSDTSEAVQLVSLEGLSWYYAMGQLSAPEFRRVLRSVQKSRSLKLADLASTCETKFSLSDI